MNTLLIIIVILAVAVALFAWAAVTNQNASLRKYLARVWLKHHLISLLFRQPDSFGGTQFCNVGTGTHEKGHKSYIADAATAARYLFYEQGVTSNDYCKLALGVNEPFGPSDDLADANALDIPIAIKLLGAFHGTTRAISDGSVTNNTRIAVSKDGTGRAICPAGGAGNYWVVGKAIVPSDNDAGGPVAANDDFEFVPCFPVKVAY